MQHPNQNPLRVYRALARPTPPAPTSPSASSETSDVPMRAPSRLTIGQALTEYFTEHVEYGVYSIDPYDSRNIDPIVEVVRRCFVASPDYYGDDEDLGLSKDEIWYMLPLHEEHRALCVRQRRLADTLRDEHACISQEQRKLLEQQHEIQKELIGVLAQRLRMSAQPPKKE